MRIASIRVRNFRGLRDLEVPLARNTVFIGENNSGKSSLLDCISLALGRRWGQRGTGFSDYDVTIPNELSSTASHEPEEPSAAEGDSGGASDTPDGQEQIPFDALGESEALQASIELRFAEQENGEWPEDITSGLFGIIQTDPATGLNAITLRVNYSFNELEKSYEPGWTFVDINGDPIGGSEARRAANTSGFFKFVPIFTLNALRDASEEFSSRSQFWGRILKAVAISPEEKRALDDAIDELNSQLLAADPRVSETVDRLKQIQTVVAHGAAEDVSIRSLPLKVWELLSRSEVVMKGEPEAPWLPLSRHGQGVKSLSVLYLFAAFVERLLGEAYSPHSEAIVTLEEPEVHLHPQAARALWDQIVDLPGQKIVASHSPYFVQTVPIKDLRLLRRRPNDVEVFYVPDRVSAELPANDALRALSANDNNPLSFDADQGVVSSSSPIDEPTYRRLLRCFTEPEEVQHHPAIARFRDESKRLLDEADIEELEDWARRIRGEIFFSRLWLLCEGQSEYLLLTATFRAIGYDLDTNCISAIDHQNNGSARAFASLARTFGFPWVLLLDGDQQGQNTLSSLKGAGFDESELDSRVVFLPDGSDLEAYVVGSRWRQLALDVVLELSPEFDSASSDDALAEALRKHEPIWAKRLGSRLWDEPPQVNELPQAFAELRQVLLRNDPDHAEEPGP